MREGKQNVRIQCCVAVLLKQQLPVPLAKIPESLKNSHACLMNILSLYYPSAQHQKYESPPFKFFVSFGVDELQLTRSAQAVDKMEVGRFLVGGNTNPI